MQSQTKIVHNLTQADIVQAVGDYVARRTGKPFGQAVIVDLHITDSVRDGGPFDAGRPASVTATVTATVE